MCVKVDVCFSNKHNYKTNLGENHGDRDKY